MGLVDDPQGFINPESASVDGGECLVIGESNAGKTMFLMAVHRACHIQLPGQPYLEFIAGEGMQELIPQSIEILLGKKRLVGTERNHPYQFSVSAHDDRPLVRQEQRHKTFDFSVIDPPGEALFPGASTNIALMEDSHQQLVQVGKRAAAIILCADVRADQLLLHKLLPSRLGEMIIEQSIPAPSIWQRSIRRRPDLKPAFTGTRGPVRKLACKRFLLLLTKVDKAAVAAVRKLREAKSEVQFSAAELAELVAPVAQARQILGVEILSAIRSVLLPDAEFAVGICSAGGFDKSGGPFLNSSGVPIESDVKSQPEVLSRWVPFGVREAILFAAFGLYTPTIERVTLDHLRYDPVGDVRILSA